MEWLNSCKTCIIVSYWFRVGVMLLFETKSFGNESISGISAVGQLLYKYLCYLLTCLSSPRMHIFARSHEYIYFMNNITVLLCLLCH